MKTVKNYNQLTEKHRQIVDGIILIVGARLHRLTKEMQDSDGFGRKFLRFPSSKQNLALAYILLNIKQISSSDYSFFPSDLNEQLATALAEEAGYYLHGSALRDILRVLETKGILRNITGKKEVLRFAKGMVHKQKKGGEYNSSKREGQLSLYVITSNVRGVLSVLSNPVAVQIVHRCLRRSHLLNKFFGQLFLNIINVIRSSRSNNVTQTSFIGGFHLTGPLRTNGSKLNISEMQQLVTDLNKINGKKLERLSIKFAKNMVEYPFVNTLYLLFSLGKL